MKVIFLDMDGVLNSDAYFDSIKGKNIEGIEDELKIASKYCELCEIIQ